MNHLAKETVKIAMSKKTFKIILFIFTLILNLSNSDVFSQEKKENKKTTINCYKCHENLKNTTKSLNYFHSPFKEGKCSNCHELHTSNLKGLLKTDINDLCLSCHINMKTSKEKPFIHQALKSGKCTDCHMPHASNNISLLIKPVREICWQCHSTIKEEFKKLVVHNPYKSGECSRCHDVHISSNFNLLKEEPRILCQKCHQVKCKVNNININNFTKNMDCTDCHTGHASEFKGALGPFGHSYFLNQNCEKCHETITHDKKIEVKKKGMALCLECHRIDYSKVSSNDPHTNDKECACLMCHTNHASKNKSILKTSQEVCINKCLNCHEIIEKRITNIEKALKNIRCTPLRKRNCIQCHVPIHSQNILYLSKDEIMTCAKCHEAQHKIAHPLGPEVKDPRNGKPITCITCHSMHSAKADFLLYYDRKRQLCIQCHKK